MTLIPFEGHLLGNRWMKNFEYASALRADVREKEDAYVVEAELPGVKKEDVQIVSQEGMLTIAVQASEEKEQKDGEYVRRERYTGRTARSFSLKNIDEAGISAKLEDGVLYVTLPKARPDEKRIEIQ